MSTDDRQKILVKQHVVVVIDIAREQAMYSTEVVDLKIRRYIMFFIKAVFMLLLLLTVLTRYSQVAPSTIYTAHELQNR